MPVTKKYYRNGVAHPAVFSNALLPIFHAAIQKHAMPIDPYFILDPFAGVGRIHELQQYSTMYETYGLEIEPEWAELHPRTKCGDVRHIRKYFRREFDAIVTSPTYGNRMADHHDARDASLRRSYKHDLGRDLHDRNSGQLHWGAAYRKFHMNSWLRVVTLLRPNGLFILNCKDHIRGGERQRVSAWHLRTLRGLGLIRLESIPVKTPSMRAGENADLRLTEYVYVLRLDA